ncbi:hypothetical protein Pelo_16637 [Pelomyxa schiedti]|nr:hypothetical protein Pelo_16637 [Pelomyxa schiedti]
MKPIKARLSLDSEISSKHKREKSKRTEKEKINLKVATQNAVQGVKETLKTKVENQQTEVMRATASRYFHDPTPAELHSIGSSVFMARIQLLEMAQGWENHKAQCLIGKMTTPKYISHKLNRHKSTITFRAVDRIGIEYFKCQLQDYSLIASKNLKIPAGGPCKKGTQVAVMQFYCRDDTGDFPSPTSTTTTNSMIVYNPSQSTVSKESQTGPQIEEVDTTVPSLSSSPCTLQPGNASQIQQTATFTVLTPLAPPVLLQQPPTTRETFPPTSTSAFIQRPIIASQDTLNGIVTPQTTDEQSTHVPSLETSSPTLHLEPRNNTE